MVNVVETWLIVLGLINIIFLIISLVIFMPRRVYKTNIAKFYQIFRRQLPYLLLILGIVSFHIIEVNIIDPPMTKWIGIDFANNIQNIEGDTVFWFYQHWTPFLVYFFVFMYIAVYPFTLWFSPIYFLATDEEKSMKILAYGLLLIYTVALPFYLFIPISNVYTFYNVESALNIVIPKIESFFYTTTTQNNCLPSLHVATTILIAWSVYLTGNKKLSHFTNFCMVSVILSVVYLAIHWITDLIFGAILAVIVILLLNRLIKV